MPSGTDHIVTAETMETVQRLTRIGINQHLIAAYMGISKTTLSKHYKDIMAIVRVDNMAIVGQVAFEMASSGKCPNMTMFYCKTQMGWQETKEEADSVKDEPIARIIIETVGSDIKKED